MYTYFYIAVSIDIYLVYFPNTYLGNYFLFFWQTNLNLVISRSISPVQSPIYVSLSELLEAQLRSNFRISCMLSLK